jgi:UDP-2,3-diacylglucosamine hydrolase
VTVYLASDVHLRFDQPARSGRLARWVRQLDPGDRLIIGGDLCDFWMASRTPEPALLNCDGLRALAEFRNRGGILEILPGNHDLWLCPFYESVLGATILSEPVDLRIHGIRLHVVHGHLLGARRRWKAWMESREFYYAFGRVPSPLAELLDQTLEWKNQSNLEADESRHLAVFREYAASLRGRTDLVVIGHVHRVVDDSASLPRMIVLGGWQKRSSYLMINESGISFRVVADEHEENQAPAFVAPAPSPSAPSCPTL